MKQCLQANLLKCDDIHGEGPKETGYNENLRPESQLPKTQNQVEEHDPQEDSQFYCLSPLAC
jgi:hypothetical protein